MRVAKPTRRELLAAGLTGATGLWLGIQFGTRRERWAKRVPERPQVFSPSVFLAIDRNGTITIFVAKSEMGQGVRTALPMLIAEELDADWPTIQIEQAPANRNFGDQLTATSSSVRDTWIPLRTAGATARAMLVAAAASVWNDDVTQCSTSAGFVTHIPTGRRLGYGELAELAAAQAVPTSVELKAPEDFRIIGKPLAPIDNPRIVTGAMTFAVDVRIPDMAYAVVARPPVLGAKLVAFAADEVRALAGVHAVLHIGGGVAVVANSTWTALEARKRLDAKWDLGEHGDFSTASVERALVAAASEPALVARTQGNVLEHATSNMIEASYRLPYLAHAAMEPTSCTARFAAGKCEVWAATQDPQGAQRRAMQLTGLREADVIVHPMRIGGGFGRRVMHDEVIEAIELARMTGRPLQVMWSREDDIRHDRYRPASLHVLRASLSDSRPRTWSHRVVTPSILGLDSRNALDELAVDGALQNPYDIPNLTVEWTSVDLPVPLGFMRSVGHSHNAFAVECFIDELAELAKADPFDFRLELLRQSPRHLGVLDLVARASDWRAPLTDNVARGIAVHESFGSYVAQVIEASVEGDRVRVHRVVCAVDCGQVVNPDIARAQIEGGVIFALSAALFGEITHRAGAVEQSNFHDYPLLRTADTPRIEVHFVASNATPGGIGEVSVPPVAPALANAIARVSGRRIRNLPIRLHTT